MAQDLNLAILIGHLGANPELRYTAGGGVPNLRFRLATSRKFKSQDGTPKEKTTWHTVVIWGNRGKALHEILQKGTHVSLQGSIETWQSEDGSGNRRYFTQINARDLQILGKGRPRSDSGPGQGPSDAGAGEPPPPDEHEYDNFGEDDIPF